MKSYVENFDKLYFTECNLRPPAVADNDMRIPVSGLFVLRGHPLLAGGEGPYSGWLMFSGVTHSSRTVTEYIGGPMAPGGFKESYSVEDRPHLALANGDQQEYVFEGLQVEPCAWIDNWIVRAESFQLQIDDLR